MAGVLATFLRWYVNDLLQYYLITFEEKQIFVIQPSDDSCGLFLGGTKAGNERNDAIRHKNLCVFYGYRAFKHTSVNWLVLEPKGTGRGAEFICLVKLVHLFNFLHF